MLNSENQWHQLPARKLPSRIRGIIGMDVSPARNIVAVATSDTNIEIFGANTLTVTS